MTDTTSVRSVVKALEGGGVVGQLTGTSRFAVHNWVKRNQFPGHHYKVLQAAAAVKGLHIPDDLFARVLVHPSAVKEDHLTDDHSVSPKPAA